MDRKECYRLTHHLSKISGYATDSHQSAYCKHHLVSAHLVRGKIKVVQIYLRAIGISPISPVVTVPGVMKLLSEWCFMPNVYSGGRLFIAHIVGR